MNQVFPPSNLTLKNFMLSQTGNLQDPVAYTGIEPNTGPDSSSKQDFIHPPSLSSDMGLRYMTIPASNDLRFRSESGVHHTNPVYSAGQTSQPASNPTLSYSSYTNLFPTNSLSSTYSTNPNSYYPQNSTSYSSLPDRKPCLNPLEGPIGMAPPSRQALPIPGSALNPRDPYSANLRRTSEILSRSPPTSGGLRSVPLSPSSSGGFTTPNMEHSQMEGSPPLNPTEPIHQLQTSDGQPIRPEIFGKIDKGFFLADNDWTCYRRNYFALNCSFTLHPAVQNNAPVYLIQNHGSVQIHGWALSIAAVVDGIDGKPIDLVQHTPKRDKGPQDKPPRVPVQPRPHQHLYAGDNGIGNGPRGLYDQGFGANQPQLEAIFERIQFKCATANNGKRRAAQQYYHLLVELFVDLGQHQAERWIKVATRMSAPMVVRGRSPGHYQGERRASNATTGPGGAAGGGSYQTGGSSRLGGDLSMSGTSSMLPSQNYPGSYGSGQAHHYRPSSGPLQIPMEPVLSAEEVKGIVETPGYSYYPSAIYEGHDTRYTPTPPTSSDIKVKSEYSSGYMLPSLTSGQDRCGRWEGTSDTKAYFPTAAALIQQGM